MKKITAIFLTLCLLCGMAALAETYTITTDKGTGTTKLTLTIDESFTITIPAELTITLSDDPTPLEVTVSDYNLASTNQLAVSARTGGNGNIYLGGTWYSGCPSIQLMLVADDIDAWPTTDNPLVFTANGMKNINLQLKDWEDAEPGVYTDTLTITASIVAR